MPIALSPMQLWDSDYRLVHLLLTYKQKLKCAKSVVKTVTVTQSRQDCVAKLE